MSNDVYGATVILMAVASLVALRVSRHKVRVRIRSHIATKCTRP